MFLYFKPFEPSSSYSSLRDTFFFFVFHRQPTVVVGEMYRYGWQRSQLAISSVFLIRFDLIFLVADRINLFCCRPILMGPNNGNANSKSLEIPQIHCLCELHDDINIICIYKLCIPHPIIFSFSYGLVRSYFSVLHGFVSQRLYS